MIEFKAHLTVGIEGMALTEIEAQLSEGVEFSSDAKYTPRELILEDIRSACLEDWLSCWIAPKVEHNLSFGSFIIEGKAWWYLGYEDEEIEYSKISVTEQ